MDFTAGDTEIANLALAHLGVGKAIADLETENSKEARACRMFFEMSRDNTLRDFLWPFAKRSATLSLVEEDPNDEWAYSYRYPTDCLFARRIVSGVRNENEQERIIFELGGDDNGILIFTDEEDAEIEYTAKITTTGLLTNEFNLVRSYRLAHYIAPLVTSGDQFKLGDRCLAKYWEERGVARANALNEQRLDLERDGDYVSSRN